MAPLELGGGGGGGGGGHVCTLMAGIKGNGWGTQGRKYVSYVGLPYFQKPTHYFKTVSIKSFCKIQNLHISKWFNLKSLKREKGLIKYTVVPVFNTANSHRMYEL